MCLISPFSKVKCFRISAFFHICKSPGVNGSCATLYLKRSCCCGGLCVIKKTYPAVCTLLHRSSLVYGTYSSTKPNDRISGPAQNTETTLLLSSFIWQIIQAGQDFPSLHNKVDGFKPVNISRFAEKRKPVIHLSLWLPIHLLYVTMVNHVQMQFSSLFIRTLDVTQLSPVS